MNENELKLLSEKIHKEKEEKIKKVKEEVQVILNKFNCDIGAEFRYQTNGIFPVPVIIVLKAKKEEAKK